MITTEKIFDRMAVRYEKKEGQRFEIINIKTLENVKKHLRKTDTVLDYGCATGAKAIELAPYVNRSFGIDISSRMIEIARKKTSENNISNTEFIKTTIFDERFQKEQFDVIMAFNILHLLEDKESIIKRIRELLKPDGWFISITTCLGEKKSLLLSLQFLPFLLISLTKFFPNIQRFRFAELEGLIRKGGFQLLETEKLFHKMSFYYIAAKKL